MRSESTASKSYELNPGRMTYHRVQRTPAPDGLPSPPVGWQKACETHVTPYPYPRRTQLNPVSPLALPCLSNSTMEVTLFSCRAPDT